MELTKVIAQDRDAYGGAARGGGSHGGERRPKNGSRPSTRGYGGGGDRKSDGGKTYGKGKTHGSGYGNGGDEEDRYGIQLYLTTLLLTTCSWTATLSQSHTPPPTTSSPPTLTLTTNHPIKVQIPIHHQTSRCIMGLNGNQGNEEEHYIP
ncbi:hypothetical protein YC2023_088325 [Brassica napus]